MVEALNCPRVSRRCAVMQVALATLAVSIGKALGGSLPLPVTAGAIRWDAWEANNSEEDFGGQDDPGASKISGPVTFLC